MAWQFFLSLGIKQLHLKINSIGCKNCRPAYLAKLKEYYTSMPAGALSGLPRTGWKEIPCACWTARITPASRSPPPRPKAMRIFARNAPLILSSLKNILTLLKLPFEINHCLVRGLDYYTRTVFEIQPEAEGAQSTIGGGGRYDGLIEELGGKPTPAIGFRDRHRTHYRES